MFDFEAPEDGFIAKICVPSHTRKVAVKQVRKDAALHVFWGICCTLFMGGLTQRTVLFEACINAAILLEDSTVQHMFRFLGEVTIVLGSDCHKGRTKAGHAVGNVADGQRGSGVPSLRFGLLSGFRANMIRPVLVLLVKSGRSFILKCCTVCF